MTTPMMLQYRAAKAARPDAFLLFRMGDFYEVFYEDAERLHAILGLTLTARNGVPMAGVPYRNVDGYVHRLIKLGHRVAVCDQTQEKSEAKGIAERAITRVVTPGTIVDEGGLDDREHNFLVALVLSKEVAGIAAVDLSTATFLVEEVPAAEAKDAVARAQAAELLIPEEGLEAKSAYATALAGLAIPKATLPGWRFDASEGARKLCEHFQVAGLDGFGLGDLSVGIGAAAAALHYLQETQRGAVTHLTGLRRVRREEFMHLDRATQSSLEIHRTERGGDRRGSLVSVLDRTLTPLGARLLTRWLAAPLRDLAVLRARQEAVAELRSEADVRAGLRGALKLVLDLDRLLSRIATGRASARELVAIRQSLRALPVLRAELTPLAASRLREIDQELPDLADLRELLDRALLDEVPPTVKEGGIIRDGFDPELDELRAIGKDGRGWIADFQTKEQARTGISTLKVGFNKVFGFYIEITNVHQAKVPLDYIRKQTIKNAERYITPDLKAYEEKVLGADERINEREYEHFLTLRRAVEERLRKIQAAASAVAELDVLQGLAEVASERRWSRPELDESADLVIEEGRHPVLEALHSATPIVPNDVSLSGQGAALALITGPNMGGKSTFIRQAALLSLLGQIGSFVPAKSMRLGLIDRIFARIGASDELARGNSTFMVEMIETAEILHHATGRSLVILDEVGRGTSTTDGLALARAVTEHLAGKIRCRTLFATHYHELVEVVENLPHARNLSVAVQEWQDQIVFLHRIVAGGTDRSYGIHVARLAGLPRLVVSRAEELLRDLRAAAPATGQEIPTQLGLFPSEDDRLREELLRLEPDRLTPLDALIRLKQLCDLARGRA